MLYNSEFPHIIKYMGSKKKILDFVVDGLNVVYNDGKICDLFSGAGNLAGSIGTQVEFISNDIQEYSSILANLYLYNDKTSLVEDIIEKIDSEVIQKVSKFKKKHSNLEFEYYDTINLKEFKKLELKQRELINHDFFKEKFHLFTKYYSGTYWSFDQCIEIDIIRSIAERYKGTFIYYAVISSLMFGMAYTSQSTGHYAQYREAKDEKSKNDILMYRLKSLKELFKKKMYELMKKLKENNFSYKTTSLDYLKCLDLLKEGDTVYADPPYGFVHYSRFYHILETLTKYDYPTIEHKGRYRNDRHQSPFCKKTEVGVAFNMLFEKVKEKKVNLVLSYSNNGMISLEEIQKIADNVLAKKCDISIRTLEHLHSTMGRREDKSREVEEALILIKNK